MKNLWHAGRLLLLDMASTVVFLVVLLLTKSIPLAVGLGVAFGVGQIGWQLARKRPIDTMEWLSLFVVVASGSATLLTQNPRFVMLKPTLIYGIVGVAMLKPGWINRYLPPVAKILVPDIAVILGYAWAGLMFLSAALNVAVALTYSVAAWAAFMSVYAIVSKLALFLVGYAVMRAIARRRWRAMPTLERDGLTALASQQS
jgi:intracellular septation protein A